MLDSAHLKSKSFSYKDNILQHNYYGHTKSTNFKHTGFGIKITNRSIEEGQWIKGKLQSNGRIIYFNGSVQKGIPQGNKFIK